MNGQSVNDNLNWSIEFTQIFPKFYFHKQDSEKELVAYSPKENRSLGFSFGKVLNHRFELTVGIQRVNRTYYLQYEPKRNTDINRIEHSSSVRFVPIIINISAINNRYVKIKLQAGLAPTMIKDNVTKEYLSPTIPNYSRPDVHITNFLSGLIGLRLEKNIFKERFYISAQTNYVHKLTNYSPRFNSTNRITLDFGIKYRFRTRVNSSLIVIP